MATELAIPAPGGAVAVTQGKELAAAAIAAKAKATVESRYLMALRAPRNEAQARRDILDECQRPAFAHNPSALYKKPVGKGVEGLGIRFVEAALRHWRNVLVESEVLYSDDQEEVHMVTVTDLEKNLTYPQQIVVTKTVERSGFDPDEGYLSVRMNSYNKPVYTVRATDDDMLNKRAAMISKAIRTLGLRIIPGDIQDEAEVTIRTVREDKAAQDPQAEAKAIVDGFASLGVKVEALNTWLGHDLAACSPAQLVELRAMWMAIRDGEATWHGFVTAKREKEARDKAAADVDENAAAPGTIAAINAGIRNKAAPQKDAAAPPLFTAVMKAIAAAEKSKDIGDLAIADDMARKLVDPAHKAQADVEIRRVRKVLEK